MKNLMQRVKSFITFDFPLQADYIQTEFATIHVRVRPTYQIGVLQLPDKK